jgi:outer membrane protein assembly factor BamB
MKLTPNRNRLRVAALTFLCGLTLSWALRPAPHAATPATTMTTTTKTKYAMTTASPAAQAPVPYSDWGESPQGEEWKHRNNGWRLPLNYGVLGAHELAEAKVLPLPSGRVFVAAADELDMFNDYGERLWSRYTPKPFRDVAYVAATDLIYVTADGNNLLILDAQSGRELHRLTRGGSDAFGQTVAYGPDQCLVTDDNSADREGDGFAPTASDGVSAWRGTTMLWRRDLPPDAELRVSGDRIFAVTKTSTRILVTEITPPALTP